jgi:hypothetical protein
MPRERYFQRCAHHSRMVCTVSRRKAPPKRILNGAPARLKEHKSVWSAQWLSVFGNRALVGFLFLLAVVGPSLSQTPQLFAYGGLSLNRSGSIPASEVAGLGMDVEANHLYITTEGSINNAHPRNWRSGYEIVGKTRIFCGIGRGWAVGAGAQWSKFPSSTYSKQAWRPSIGAFKDFKHPDFSARIQLMYVPPDIRFANSHQVMEIGMWLPSPATHRHLFYRELASVSEFKKTSSPHARRFRSSVEFTVMYRR